MSETLLTAKEVGLFLRISQASLYRRIADGTIPKPLKLGAASRWPKSEVEAAISAVGDRRSQ